MAQIDPSQVRRTHQIIWFVLLVSQLIYVALTLSGLAKTREEPLDVPAFPIALAVVALGTGIGSHLYWRRATGAGRSIHMSPPDPAASFTSYMLAWVFDESIAVYGLMLGLLAFSVNVWVPFSLAAFVLILVHRPA